ncbi:MAG: hypothetical protein AABX08_01585 [Nanoarchaeota archaeon]
MGKIKYIDKIRRFLKESPVVNINSLKKFINKKNKDYIYLIINNLIKKGEMKKIVKGFYSIHEDPSLAVFCFKPAYLGLQDALSVHDLWEQETNPVIITTKKARVGLKKIFGNNVVIRRINKKYFFGFEYIKQGDFYFPYSDIEKTFIDMVYFKQYLDKEVLKEFSKKIDKKKLDSYLKNYPERIRKRVKSYLKI